MERYLSIRVARHHQAYLERAIMDHLTVAGEESISTNDTQAEYNATITSGAEEMCAALDRQGIAYTIDLV